MAALTLDQMTAQLCAAYGDTLRAVVLYGSAARAGRSAPAPGRGYDLLVIVDTLGMEQLRRVAPTTRAWAEAGHPPPLTLTTLEWRASADVFAMEYAEVLAAHDVLAGALPLDGIAVDPADLRRQLEHQTLGALLRLRGGILASGNDGGRLADLLAASRSTVLVLFRTLARLHGVGAPADPAALAEWAGRVAGFDAAPFVRVLRPVATGPGAGGSAVGRVASGAAAQDTGTERVPVPAAEAADVLAGYLEALERLVAHVDRWAPPAGPSVQAP